MDGKHKPLKQVSEETGIPYKIVWQAAADKQLKCIRPGVGAHPRYFTTDAWVDAWRKECATC